MHFEEILSVQILRAYLCDYVTSSISVSGRKNRMTNILKLECLNFPFIGKDAWEVERNLNPFEMVSYTSKMNACLPGIFANDFNQISAKLYKSCDETSSELRVLIDQYCTLY